MSHLFFQLITSVLALFFIVLGALGVVVPWSEPMRQMVIRFFQENWITIFLFGLGFLVVGLAMLFNIIMSARRQHYSLRAGALPVTVDSALVESYLTRYWKRRYPRKEIATRVTVKDEIIQISADLPALPREKQKQLLTEIERDLQDLLAKHLGYRKTFRLLISFGE